MKRIFAFGLCALTSACAHQTLPQHQSPSHINTIKVFKSDQSKQCEARGIAPDDMRQELIQVGVDVLCTHKAYDGMMHASVCGGATGAINVFVIHSDNLGDAKALGFMPVSTLRDYQDVACVQ